MKNLYQLSDWTDVKEHQKIGEILIACGKITLDQLGIALDLQKKRYIPIGQILLEMKVISQNDLKAALNLQEEIEEYIETIYNQDKIKD